jgi:hypothetical protein
MYSMHIFLQEKTAPYGVRFSLEDYSQYNQIQIVPLYAVGDWYSQEAS